LNRLRQDVACRLDPESIQAACRQAGHRWRHCLLDPVALWVTVKKGDTYDADVRAFSPLCWSRINQGYLFFPFILTIAG
jgi:hypothetical protein